MGPQGPAGLNGVDGNNGLDGATGPMGPQGPAGLNGVDGNNGLDGATGPIGQGVPGLNGVDGANGLDGAMGPMGPQGVPGPVGPAGPAGSAVADDVFHGLPRMMSGHTTGENTAVTYFSPMSVSAGPINASSALYVPSNCTAQLFVTSYMTTPVTYRLRSVEPSMAHPSTFDLGAVIDSCPAGEFGQQCVIEVPLSGDSLFTIEVVQMFPEDAQFFTSFECKASAD
jgi:hypothetical protein